jgi:hypothetical protein
MPETLPIADAMEEAQGLLDGEMPTDIDAAIEAAPAASTDPVQVPLFEPPPFDFEAAYDELHRLDARARLRKSAWEIAKSDASDAKKSYDTTIEDLHKKFAEIERARSDAARPSIAPTTAPTEEEVMPMSEMEQTIDETPEESPPPADAPTDETSSDAPVD